jgi:hypothetical protein
MVTATVTAEAGASTTTEKHMTFQANAVEPALPGHWRCPLEGAAAKPLRGWV